MTTIKQSRVVPLDDIEIVSRAKGGDGRTVVAYAAVFNIPVRISDAEGQYQEQISPPAFNRSLGDGRGIGVFYNHAKTLHGESSELASVPIGHPTSIVADSRGLLTTTAYNRTSLADDVLEAIRNGDVKGQSFTGVFVQSSPEPPLGGKYVRSRSGELTLVTRTEIVLIEYGPTPIPAYADAEILSLRTADDAGHGETCTCPRCRTRFLAEMEARSGEQGYLPHWRRIEMAELDANAADDDYQAARGEFLDLRATATRTADGRARTPHPDAAAEIEAAGRHMEAAQADREYFGAYLAAVKNEPAEQLAQLRAQKLADDFSEMGWTGSGYLRRY